MDDKIAIDMGDGTIYIQRRGVVNGSDAPLSGKEEVILLLSDKIKSLEAQLKQNTAQAAAVINSPLMEQPSHEDFMMWLSDYRDEFIAKSQMAEYAEALNERCVEDTAEIGVLRAQLKQSRQANDAAIHLSQLSKQSEGVTISHELNSFLHGWGQIDGLSFGDAKPFGSRGRIKARYWWRKLLPELKK